MPTEEVVEMRDGQRRKSERKFYPGYVLVQMDMDEQTWHLVRDVPKVLGFIGGTPDKPAPITEKEANQILRRVEEGVDKPRPKVLFEPGEVVRVTNGPFNDFNGVVENVNYEKSRLQVAVQILGRSTPVELDFSSGRKGLKFLYARAAKPAVQRAQGRAWGVRREPDVCTQEVVRHGKEGKRLRKAAGTCRRRQPGARRSGPRSVSRA